MPWSRPRRRHRSRSRRPRYRNRRATRTGAPLMRNIWTRRKRVQQNLTRDVRWFKEVRTIQSNTGGNFREVFRPIDVANCADFANWAKIWEEYKILQIIVRMFPAAVGSESLQENIPPPDIPSGIASFKRGDVITWVDQGDLDVPTDFNRIIIKPSAKLLQPRKYHKRYINRPYGNPNWGQLDTDGTILLGDEWTDTRIQVFGTNFTPSTVAGSQVWYYVTVSYKLLFRGRQEIPPPAVP